MPAINFRKQYAKAIEAGTKRCTIRPARKDNKARAKPGDTLSLYWGMRTKHCTLIRRVTCTSVQPIELKLGRNAIGNALIEVTLDGKKLDAMGLTDLAHMDGFKDSTAMAEFFAPLYGDGMKGQLIRWRTE